MLAGEFGDEVEVLVQVQNDEIGELGGRRNHQVRDARCAVLPTAGQHALHFKRSLFNARCQ